MASSMKIYCAGHQKKHEDTNWKLQEGGVGWFCSAYFKPTTHEWVPQRVKEERKIYKKDILQPWRSGEPSAEFIEAYPKQAKKMFTPKDIKKARKVWD